MKLINRTSKTAAEVLIYDVIGAGMFGGISAKEIDAELKELGPVDELLVRINSPGGDVIEGLAIFNILRAHSARKVARVEGEASSIASVILQAADERRMPGNAYVMIHEPRSFGAGTASKFREIAELLDRTHDNVLNIYERATTGIASRARIDELMRAETYFIGAEALEVGLVDAIDDEIAVAACDLSVEKARALGYARPEKGAAMSKALTSDAHSDTSDAQGALVRLGTNIERVRAL